MRQFRLINGNDARFDLNSGDVFAYNPDGLGVNLGSSYYGSDINFMQQSTGLSQNVIKMSILFGNDGQDPYERYEALVKFLNILPIKMEYTIDDVGTYTRDVQLKELTKSDVNNFGTLDESITFECLSAWYKWEEHGTTRYVDQEGDGLIYRNIDLTDNDGVYTHEYVFEEEIFPDQEDWFTIVNDSIYMGLSNGAPIEITITADKEEIVNPSWQLTDVDGNVIQNDGYFCVIPLGDSLVVSSDPSDLRADLVLGDGTATSIYNSQDMTKTNFIRVPEGTFRMNMPGLLKNAKVTYRIKKELVTI